MCSGNSEVLGDIPYTLPEVQHSVGNRTSPVISEYHRVPNAHVPCAVEYRGTCRGNSVVPVDNAHGRATQPGGMEVGRGDSGRGPGAGHTVEFIKGREGKGREGKGREGKGTGQTRGWPRAASLPPARPPTPRRHRQPTNELRGGGCLRSPCVPPPLVPRFIDWWPPRFFRRASNVSVVSGRK
eukprot:gene10875-biopygen12357